MSALEVALGRDVRLSDSSDDDLLRALVWLPTAPEDLRRSASAGDVRRFWRAWSKRAVGRSDRRVRQKRIANRAIEWPWDTRREHPAKGVLSLIDKNAWSQLCRWAQQQCQAADAWQHERTETELLALADWLWSGPRISAEVGWSVWRLVLTRTLELAAYLQKPLTCELPPDRRLLVTGELPWLLGQLFADVEGVTEFKQLGQQSLRNELIELTDGDGTPAAHLLPRLPRWIASLTRSVEVSAIVGEPLLEGEARYRFEDVITKCVALLDRSGRFLGSELRGLNGHATNRRDVGCCVTMLLRGAELAGLDELSLAAEALRFRQHVASGARIDRFHSETFSESPEERLIVTDTDLPATQSDWAGWACLRNWWDARGNTALVRHDGPRVHLQLCLRGLPLIDGEWGLTVRLDGQRLTWADSWKCICWSSDTDMDYLELQLDVPGGPMLCRQVMLSRKDHFLVLADSVSKAGRRRIDVESTLPLRRGVRAKPDNATREVRLSAADVKVRCFPLALPDDRLHSTAGDFAPSLGELRLVQASSGEALYAPLVLDWSPERTVAEAEWRTLTVTEEGRKLSGWEAAGHRLRVGKLHLVVYRSLRPSDEFRAVLGLHTDKESVIAQFNEQGYVLPIVSVDA